MNGHTPRPATSADNAGLLALAAACPMRGELTLCVRREPDFFALNRLQGDRWDVGVVDGAGADVIGCIAIAERLAYVNGVEAPTAMRMSSQTSPPLPRSAKTPTPTSGRCSAGVRRKRV